MRIRRFIVTVACYDTDPPGDKQVEDALVHGMLERSGGLVARFVDERTVPRADPDWNLPAPQCDADFEDWQAQSERAVLEPFERPARAIHLPPEVIEQ